MTVLIDFRAVFYFIVKINMIIYFHINILLLHLCIIINQMNINCILKKKQMTERTKQAIEETILEQLILGGYKMTVISDKTKIDYQRLCRIKNGSKMREIEMDALKNVLNI